MAFTTEDLKALLRAFAARMDGERDALCALDGAVGDGDHGIAMQAGMRAASVVADASDGTLQDIFNAAAKGFLNAVGASSGPLYASALMRAAKVAGPRQSMPTDELRGVIAAMRDGIVHRGKAEPGQKTMLDAWAPAAAAAEGGKAPDDIADAARQGAKATSEMVAGLGRASRLGSRSLGHPDPGAVSAAMLIEVICSVITSDTSSTHQ